MAIGPEYALVEKPCLDYLASLGYSWLPPNQNEAARDSLNQVILRDTFLQAIQRINNIPAEVARATYQDLLSVTDNEIWTQLLRGNYSRNVPGEATKKTIRLVDFSTPGNNTFTITNQFKVKAQQSRIADIVVFLNGIPVVVLEAKRPFASKDKTGEAFDQIKQYERDIPRLFYANLFNLITDGLCVLYGTTGADAKAWADWKDPYPKQNSDFSNSLEKGLWCLLEPERLLDLLAHFIVFEKREQTVTKKLCRYQQFRAVNKIVQRVLEHPPAAAVADPNPNRKGLIWHTQGSGKSLTMAFATLKLKTHRTLQAPVLANPNILVLTDRIDLDDQIARTFEACGLPNPRQIQNAQALQAAIHTTTVGLTLLSTIFKFEGSAVEVPNSHNWIVLVDECHRTQEKDLGAYLRKTLEHACFFGFTGTPIKKTDKDTYKNFSPPNEGYLDRYSIDDAVADGATVPIRYTSRMTKWQIEPDKLDILFDNWFAAEPEDVVNRIKQRGITIEDLAKHRQRINLLAYDIWTHFLTHAVPEGFRAQIVAIDREAIILYKRALDPIITKHLEKQGIPPDQAREWAAQMTVPIYSSNQEDGKPSENLYTNQLRQDLKRYTLQDSAEKAAIGKFTGEDAEYEARVSRGEAPPVYILIVCNKLLTGFDAPRESVMYLDSALKEHSLLQAIARTNRTCGPYKEFGLIVDYIGITRHLTDALASYRQADIQNALVDLEVERARLKDAYAEVQPYLDAIPRHTNNLRQEYEALVTHLGSEDEWFLFHRKAKAFIKAYDALSPDPFVLDYREDLKWVASFLHFGILTFEKREPSLNRDVSAKIRDMLEEHLHVTGIATLCKLHNLTDLAFWQDFTLAHEDNPDMQLLQVAAVRKTAELKKILRQKVDENPLQYGPFSEQVREAIRRFEEGQVQAAELLKHYEQTVRKLQAEETAHRTTGLDPKTYGVFKILEAFKPSSAPSSSSRVREKIEPEQGYKVDATEEADPLEAAAKAIAALYTSNDTAPPGWHLKEQLRKSLRQQVRAIVFNLGLVNWKEIPGKVDEYAIKHYVRL